jgi:hypothetical protein
MAETSLSYFVLLLKELRKTFFEIFSFNNEFQWLKYFRSGLIVWLLKTCTPTDVFEHVSIPWKFEDACVATLKMLAYRYVLPSTSYCWHLFERSNAFLFGPDCPHRFYFRNSRNLPKRFKVCRFEIWQKMRFTWYD